MDYLRRNLMEFFTDMQRRRCRCIGLKPDDRIIEINGVNIRREPHGEVFSRINAIDGQVSLLVVDSATEQYLRQRDVVVDGRMTNVLRVTCPDVNPATAAAVAIATDSDINKSNDSGQECIITIIIIVE